MERFNFSAFKGKVIQVDYFNTTRLAFLKLEDEYLVLIEYFDLDLAKKGRTLVDYFSSYIDACYHYDYHCEYFKEHLF